MDQFSVISNILSFLPNSDYIACSYVNHVWYDVSHHYIRLWDNWQRNEVVIKLAKQGPVTLTKLDNKIACCFCKHRGLYFDLYTHYTDSKCIKIIISSILDPELLLLVVLDDKSFNYTFLGQVVYHKIFDSYFIQIGKLLIDCSDLMNDLKIYKGEKDNVWSLSQVFFCLKKTNVPKLSVIDTTFPFRQTEQFFTYCHERTTHNSLENPKKFHYVVSYRDQLTAFSFDGITIYREVTLDLKSINIAIQSETEQIVVSDRYLIILNDETPIDYPFLLIIDLVTKFIISYELKVSDCDRIELCPFYQNKFMILFRNKNQQSDYQILTIGTQVSLIQSGKLDFAKISKNHQYFRDFVRSDGINSKLVYANKSKICELFIK